MRTTDGYTVTTVEQDGPFAGEEIGRVYLLRRYGLTYWGLGSTIKAQRLANQAQGLKASEFEQLMDAAALEITPCQ